jgi:hypothetical protein
MYLCYLHYLYKYITSIDSEVRRSYMSMPSGATSRSAMIRSLVELQPTDTRPHANEQRYSPVSETGRLSFSFSLSW